MHDCDTTTKETAQMVHFNKRRKSWFPNIDKIMHSAVYSLLELDYIYCCFSVSNTMSFLVKARFFLGFIFSVIFLSLNSLSASLLQQLSVYHPTLTLHRSEMKSGIQAANCRLSSCVLLFPSALPAPLLVSVVPRSKPTLASVSSRPYKYIE